MEEMVDSSSLSLDFVRSVGSSPTQKTYVKLSKNLSKYGRKIVENY